jgi:hypothetical protein
LEIKKSTIHQSKDVIQKHFGQKVNQQNTISVFFSAMKIKFLELIVHLHGKILDQYFNRLKVIALSIILMKMILKFVNQRIKTKIISSQMKQLLIRLVKMCARFLCKFKTDNGMVVHKLMIRLIINFHKERIRSRKQLMNIMVDLDKVTMTMNKETTSTSVVTL